MTKILDKKPAKRKNWKLRFMADVHFFHTRKGMKYEAIGKRAIGNRRFWDRLVNGGTITLEVADKFYEWMVAEGFHFNPEGACYVED